VLLCAVVARFFLCALGLCANPTATAAHKNAPAMNRHLNPEPLVTSIT
jgi:hypothetical protein